MSDSEHLVLFTHCVWSNCLWAVVYCCCSFNLSSCLCDLSSPCWSALVVCVCLPMTAMLASVLQLCVLQNYGYTLWLYLSAPCCCCFCWWCGWYWCSWLWLMTTMVATSEKLCLCRWFSPSRLWSSKSLWYHNLQPRERAWPNSLCSRPAERPLQVGLVCLCGNWVDLLEFQLKASLSAMVLSLHISLFQISFSFMTGLWYCQRDRRLLI